MLCGSRTRTKGNKGEGRGVEREEAGEGGEVPRGKGRGEGRASAGRLEFEVLRQTVDHWYRLAAAGQV